ncbi:amidohydrolase family protein [bacterium BFN5]|nr:amidohydrolase family protein [bacterium BFN5]
MVVFNWDQYDLQFIANLALPVRNLTLVIKQDRGARIGQSTVVSQKVHTFNPSTPQIINVLQDVDAGQAFYQRSTRGHVYHLDIFHQRALIDHHLIAAAIKKAVDAYNFQFSVNNLVFAQSGSSGVNADYIDIQTGTGGGRITGALRHGKKLSLRRAHENHVHVVIMIQPQHVAFLFFVVLAVEGVILQENIELRRNEQIIHMTSQEQANPDLTNYTDQTDSFMQEKGAQNGLPQEAKQHKFVNDSLELTDDFDTIKDVQEFLNKVNDQNKNKLPDLIRILTFAVDRLDTTELIDFCHSHGIIPSAGHTAADYLAMTQATKAGIRRITHAFNAMPGIHHRKPGPMTEGLLNADIELELIADGVHVHPAILEMAFRLKPQDKITLISDGTRSVGMPEGEYELGGLMTTVKNGIARLTDGTIAGSAYPLLQGIRTMVQVLKRSLPEAVRFASLNPARSLGIAHRLGSLEPGKEATFVRLSSNLNVKQVWVKGKLVVERSDGK